LHKDTVIREVEYNIRLLLNDLKEVLKYIESRVGTGPAGSDKTGRKVHPAGQNRIFFDFFAGFLPD
jgi:hypothetical protein